ncbi:MAG: metallophosphoesterase [Clostridia bacterium]|nr:metallophosphoesterase [Clostridia bacterium]MBQ8817659.1 metallophosphoesterase [Clostridia bacterium]
MTYVVSDLHGCFDKFKKLLKEIQFSDDDVMYVLGDIVDYGDEPMELLCDLSMRYNVIPILGDCDYRAYRLLTELNKMLSGETPDAETLAEMAEWMQNGGQKTIEGFKALDDDMREGALEYLADMSLYEEAEVSGKKYILVHAGIADFDEDTPLEDYMPEDFISEALDVDRQYFADATVIAGHTPTYNVDGAENGKIYKGEYGIIIDCGAAFGETLGCLRLEDGKKFYIE